MRTPLIRPLYALMTPEVETPPLRCPRVAKKYQKAFERLENDDTDYSLYLMEDCNKIGLPATNDWNNAKAFINFLKMFYDIIFFIL